MLQSADKDLYRLAEQLVAAKGRSTGAVQDEMVQEVVALLERSIQVELLSRMSKEQMDSFNEMLASESTDEDITDFVTKTCDIDINNVTTVALTKARSAYLGA
jgi:succinate dehydrogenase flavin-adding protein (antitoxin of CptAB toxin-antitoxin module)